MSKSEQNYYLGLIALFFYTFYQPSVHAVFLHSVEPFRLVASAQVIVWVIGGKQSFHCELRVAARGGFMCTGWSLWPSCGGAWLHLFQCLLCPCVLSLRRGSGWWGNGGGSRGCDGSIGCYRLGHVGPYDPVLTILCLCPYLWVTTSCYQCWWDHAIVYFLSHPVLLSQCVSLIISLSCYCSSLLGMTNSILV
jgi:hypothetical protein